MPTPNTSHPIRIKIYDINNALLEGATVELTLGTNDPISKNSNSKGEVLLNVANAGSWSVSDEVSITASKTGSGRKTSTLVLTSSPQSLNMTLEETSDLIYHPNESNQYNLNFSLLTTYDGEKVTQSNPLPVESQSPLLEEPAMTVTYDSRNRLSTQTITVRGTQYRRTFTYAGNSFQFTTRSEWSLV